MLRHMVEHPAGWRLPACCALIAVVADAAAGAAAVAAGADVVDLGDAAQAELTAFRSAHPAVPVCGSAGPAEIVRDQRMAAATGAWLICADPQSARRTGLAAGRLLVLASPAETERLAAAGWHPVVDADAHGGSGQAGVIAAAAVSCWLGAAAVLTTRPGPVRQALDMTASIAGRRPPARAVRGLA